MYLLGFFYEGGCIISFKNIVKKTYAENSKSVWYEKALVQVYSATI